MGQGNSGTVTIREGKDYGWRKEPEKKNRIRFVLRRNITAPVDRIDSSWDPSQGERMISIGQSCITKIGILTFRALIFSKSFAETRILRNGNTRGFYSMLENRLHIYDSLYVLFTSEKVSSRMTAVVPNPRGPVDCRHIHFGQGFNRRAHRARIPGRSLHGSWEETDDRIRRIRVDRCCRSGLRFDRSHLRREGSESVKHNEVNQSGAENFIHFGTAYVPGRAEMIKRAGDFHKRNQLHLRNLVCIVKILHKGGNFSTVRSHDWWTLAKHPRKDEKKDEKSHLSCWRNYCGNSPRGAAASTCESVQRRMIEENTVYRSFSRAKKTRFVLSVSATERRWST
ncbi:unnamed protein product [Nesidiocoris tenuis]|uniref:Uncharacterized protein n=1 Tax=Nesidiocoris tenuis TaxID=355587 RepID=A0A6H5H9V0_9HEMI|nr:unnamed protein product [Nesidiocoris tenuis]CAB0012455.1 unnamed protein product [Nesidiocoris tenuis]